MQCSLEDSSQTRGSILLFICITRRYADECLLVENPTVNVKIIRKFVKHEKVNSEFLRKKKTEVTDGYPSKLDWTWYMFVFNNQILV